MAEEIKNDNNNFITREESYQFFQSILQNYSGVFRVQSGLLQSTKLRLVNLSADPTVGEVGDLVVVGGILKICTSTTPTWTVVGDQS